MDGLAPPPPSPVVAAQGAHTNQFAQKSPSSCRLPILKMPLSLKQCTSLDNTHMVTSLLPPLVSSPGRKGTGLS